MVFTSIVYYICSVIKNKQLKLHPMSKVIDMITRFEAGNIYTMNFIGDSDLKPEYICTKVTAKTATFEKFKGTEKITRRIKTYNQVEYILLGSYSMAPSIRADKVAG